MADEAQPDEGQGEAGTTGLFDSYLQAVPEEHRPVVEGFLADAAKNVDSRLREAADTNNTLGPYREVEALTQYKPDELSQLLAWHQQVSSSPDAYREWLTNAAKEEGLTPAEQQEVEEQLDSMTPEQIRALALEAAQPIIAPMQERIDQWEQTQWVNSEAELISSRLADLEAEHNLKLDDEQKQRVMKLAESLADDNASLQGGTDWIKPGFDLYMQVRAEGAKGLVDDKTKQPTPALSSGGVATHELPKTWEEARLRVGERLRQSRT